jgi:uncharacterized membrane protein
MQTTGTLQPGQSEWLQREAEAWVREGLIKEEQRRWVLARYGLVSGESAASLKRFGFVQILAVMGAVLTGIGVLVLVGTNWEEIPRYVRLALIIVASLASYLGGYALAYAPGKRPAMGQALLLLGSLVWVSGVFLVGQMFHIGPPDDREYAMGLLYGAVGVLPLAYVLRSGLQLGLGLILLLAWGGIAAADRWDLEQGMVAAALATAAFLHGLCALHRRLGPKGFSTVYGIGAAALGLGSLYVLSFNGFWSGLHWYRATHPPTAIWAVPLSLAVAGFAVAVVAGFVRGQGAKPADAEIGLIAGTGVLAVGAGAWMFSIVGSAASGPAPAVVANIALLAAEVGVVWLGWQRLRTGLVNLGLAVFFLHAMTRYFDLIGRMMNNGLVFVGAGLLLLAMGWLLERQRRSLVSAMEERGA